jgi:hypothetical protein
MFSGEWPGHVNHLNGTAASVIAVLLVFAASGKSAQGPFCGWLARAMEGPTPSSAVFYGAISVHAGAYLLLRIEPLIRYSNIATGLVIFIGLTTAILSTLIHRTCADAKTSLAYASQTQLGIIFAEIGLGWTTLAILHIISHAMVRTMQFLRSPSMLSDYHRVKSAAGGHLEPTGDHYESLLPKPVQIMLYRIALGRGFYDALVDRFLIAPVKGHGGTRVGQKHSFHESAARRAARHADPVDDQARPESLIRSLSRHDAPFITLYYVRHGLALRGCLRHLPAQAARQRSQGGHPQHVCDVGELRPRCLGGACAAWRTPAGPLAALL